MSETYQTTLEAAMLYASLGWSVFPTEGATNPDRAKHPARNEVAHWSSESTNDIQQIAAWFSMTGYGIGVDCGKSNIVALDADNPALIPDVSLSRAWELRGNPRRKSFIFDQPDDQRIGCSKGGWVAGEVKGEGGYICLPPSYHAVGGHYVWTDTSGDRHMPDDVKQLLKVETSDVDVSTTYATPGDMCAVVDRAIGKRMQLLTNLQVGRYQQMLSGMYELAALGAEGHEGTFQAFMLLRDAYVLSVSDARDVATARSEWDRAARGLERGVRHSEGVRCLGTRCGVDAARDGVTGLLGVGDTESGYELRVARRVEQLRVDVEARKRLRIEQSELWVPPEASSLASLVAESAMPDRIEGLLNANGVALLVAQRKTGKTTVVGNVVRSLCDGLPLFDRYAALPEMGVVGLFDLEMTPALLGAWVSRLEIARLDTLKIFSVRGKVGQTFAVLQESPEKFGEWLRSQEITTLIIDPLAPLLVSLGIDEADNAGVRRFLTMLRDVASEAGVGELVLSHHSGWSETGRSRGASSFEDAPDVIWRLQREGERRLFSVIGRTQEIEPCPIVLNKETGLLTMMPDELYVGDF